MAWSQQECCRRLSINIGKFYRHYAEQRGQRQGSTYCVSPFIWSFIAGKTHLFFLKKLSWETKEHKWTSRGGGNIHYLSRDTDYMNACICWNSSNCYWGEKRIRKQVTKMYKTWCLSLKQNEDYFEKVIDRRPIVTSLETKSTKYNRTSLFSLAWSSQPMI